MEVKDLLVLQTKRGAKMATTGSITKASLDKVISDCRKNIEAQSKSYRNLDAAGKKERIQGIIREFIMQNTPLVDGFVTEDGQPDTVKLVFRLTEEITDYGILSSAMADDDVFEIRGNCKEIKVEKKGRVQDLTDADGNIISFSNPTQQEVIMKKLMGDTRLTPKDAFVSGSTVEGYRIAACHSSAISPDPNDPVGDKYHAFVLRKFKKTKMGLPEIIKFRTMSDNMGRLLALCTAGGLTFVTVGPTASGKTTTNNAILQSVPATTRTVLIQNPSEIDLRFKDDTGRVYNDVLHLECIEKENPTPKDPTMVNAMAQTLRLSPTFVALGEIRTNREFKSSMLILQGGHPLNATYHAESSLGGIKRYQTAYLAESGNEPAHLALATITNLINIVIVQKILRDGTRRVIQISEILGVDPNNRDEPLINDIYRYDIIGEPEYDSAGNIKKINGVHKRVGKLSDRAIRKFELEGVAKSRYDFLLSDPNPNEVEQYTGENIYKYGMKLGS